MDLSFFPLTLEAVDQAAAESLCLFIASDERPLTGLAGLADWRLSGRLSRLLRSGLLTGSEGEAVLTQPGARLGFQKMFLFGLGRADQSDEQLLERVAQALHKLADAGVRDIATQLPVRLTPEAGLRAVIAQLQGPGRAMLFAADPQKLVGALAQVATGGEARMVKLPGAASPKTAPPPPRPPPPARAPTPPGTPRVPAAAPFSRPADKAPLKPPERPPEERRPAPPPPQRYAPPAPKPNVFEKGKKK